MFFFKCFFPPIVCDVIKFEFHSLKCQHQLLSPLVCGSVLRDDPLHLSVSYATCQIDLGAKKRGGGSQAVWPHHILAEGP